MLLRTTFGVLLSATMVLAAQLPESFRTPVVGYIQHLHFIRPIVGILGSARIAAPLDLGIRVRDAVFLSDQAHAIVVSPDAGNVVLVDLQQPSNSRPIAGAPSSVSMMRAAGNGETAGLYYPQTSRILVVKGLPEAPAVGAAVDLTFTTLPLIHFTLSDDGDVMLLVFRDADSDVLYSWSTPAGSRYVAKASRVSELVFAGSDAVVADMQAEQILLIQDVRNRAVPILLATSRDGLSTPVALAIAGEDIYVAGSEDIFVLNRRGRLLRKLACSCEITRMTSLGRSAFLLTGTLDEPLFVFDAGTTPERVVFIPALAPQEPKLPE